MAKDLEKNKACMLLELLPICPERSKKAFKIDFMEEGVVRLATPLTLN